MFLALLSSHDVHHIDITAAVQASCISDQVYLSKNAEVLCTPSLGVGSVLAAVSSLFGMALLIVLLSTLAVLCVLRPPSAGQAGTPLRQASDLQATTIFCIRVCRTNTHCSNGGLVPPVGRNDMWLVLHQHREHVS